MKLIRITAYTNYEIWKTQQINDKITNSTHCAWVLILLYLHTSLEVLKNELQSFVVITKEFINLIKFTSVKGYQSIKIKDLLWSPDLDQAC